MTEWNQISKVGCKKCKLYSCLQVAKNPDEVYAALEIRPLHSDEVRLMNHTERIWEWQKCCYCYYWCCTKRVLNTCFFRTLNSVHRSFLSLSSPWKLLNLLSWNSCCMGQRCFFCYCPLPFLPFALFPTGGRVKKKVEERGLVELHKIVCYSTAEISDYTERERRGKTKRKIPDWNSHRTTAPHKMKVKREQLSPPASLTTATYCKWYKFCPALPRRLQGDKWCIS